MIQDDAGRYLHTRAVGKVVSGKLKKNPFKSLRKDKLDKRRLNPVGFVPQKQTETEIREHVNLVTVDKSVQLILPFKFQLSQVYICQDHGITLNAKHCLLRCIDTVSSYCLTTLMLVCLVQARI